MSGDSPITVRPTPVEIIRPDQRASASASRIVAWAAEFFLTAWFVMLSLPAAVGWHWGYLRVAAVLFVIRWMWQPRRPTDTWSRSFTAWRKGDPR